MKSLNRNQLSEKSVCISMMIFLPRKHRCSLLQFSSQRTGETRGNKHPWAVCLADGPRNLKRVFHSRSCLYNEKIYIVQGPGNRFKRGSVQVLRVFETVFETAGFGLKSEKNGDGCLHEKTS